MTTSTDILHATCIAIGGAGVLITGPSGSGKSDLALRLIDTGAVLVADDQTVVARDGAGVRASAPEALAGMMEVRGIGLVSLPRRDNAKLCAVVELSGFNAVERLPEKETRDVAGVPLPLLRLDPFQPSAPARVRVFAGISAAENAPDS